MAELRGLEAVLRLVADGRLTPEEAEPIIAALTEADAGTRGETDTAFRRAGHPGEALPSARQLRIETFEQGRRVVNVTVPAGLAASLVPGLAGVHSERIRAALRAGVRGRILEVDDDGDRVVISAE